MATLIIIMKLILSIDYEICFSSPINEDKDISKIFCR